MSAAVQRAMTAVETGPCAAGAASQGVDRGHEHHERRPEPRAGEHSEARDLGEPLNAVNGVLGRRHQRESGGGDGRAREHEEGTKPAEAEGRAGVGDEEPAGFEDVEACSPGLHELERAHEEEEGE
jgi:hypothetical protein